MDSLPSNYNTKMGTAARYTNNKLLWFIQDFSYQNLFEYQIKPI